MKIKNKKILTITENLKKAFNDNVKYFPAKINFIIHKNLTLLESLTEEIYQTRDSIVDYYGIPDETEQNKFFIPEDKRKKAQNELDELLELEQEVPLMIFKFNQIEDLDFTSNQMEAMMFMIEEDSDEDEDQVE